LLLQSSGGSFFGRLGCRHLGCRRGSRQSLFGLFGFGRSLPSQRLGLLFGLGNRVGARLLCCCLVSVEYKARVRRRRLCGLQLVTLGSGLGRNGARRSARWLQRKPVATGVKTTCTATRDLTQRHAAVCTTITYES
jgi:hypothetical protein